MLGLQNNLFYILLNLTNSIDTIVVPRGAEYQAVCRGLQHANVANVGVVAVPIGLDNISQTLSSYSKLLVNSQQILILGLCGSLSKFYEIGNVLLVQSCQDFDHNQIYLDPKLTAQIQDKLSLDLVTALTSDRVISQAKEKYQLAQQYQNEVVEMEGAGYIKELHRQGKSVAMLRVVSDSFTASIPNLDNAIDGEGNIKVIATASAFLKQPIAAIRLIKGSLTGLKALEQITAKLFASNQPK